MKVRKKSIDELKEEALSLYHNKDLSPKKIALTLGKSMRTIYRWLYEAKHQENIVPHSKVQKKNSRKKYSDEIYRQIKQLKVENPSRSSTAIQNLLKKNNSQEVPSLSTIRKFLAKEGLSLRNSVPKHGYIRFQRKYPNELWQVDIAGVQSIEKVGKVYLFALLDDCSRFVPAAFYATDEKGRNVIELLRQAFLEFGRPQEILADNGRQFKNCIGELGTKYSKLLDLLDVKPIFASPYHPQTKGKLERWFGTVVKSFLSEIRFKIKNSKTYSLKELNIDFKTWLKWYNYEKSHRSLPNSTNPAEIYFNKPDRIYRPLIQDIIWERWIGEFQSRKVSKFNEIKYKGELFAVPPGFSGLRVNLVELEGKIEIYYQNQQICIHDLPDIGIYVKKKKIIRKINSGGQIKYRNRTFNLDYKMEGKKVEIQESNAGSILLVYYQDVLIKEFSLVDTLN